MAVSFLLLMPKILHNVLSSLPDECYRIDDDRSHIIYPPAELSPIILHTLRTTHEEASQNLRRLFYYI